jgi:alcohol dehydrogenase, propanol-preferring
MKVISVREPNGPLQIEDRARPSPSEGEILLRVRACGICHGDLMAKMGAFPFVRFPIVLGHEIAATVEEIGRNVQGVAVGDRVGLSVVFSSCGSCPQCKRGAENLCPEWVWTGMMVDGGYAEFVVARAKYVVPLPAQLDYPEAAPLMCAGVTIYSGLKHAGLRKGSKVAVIALGGLGHLGVLYARAAGARVAVLSSTEAKEREARELGAELFIHLKNNNGDAAGALQRWESGADIILATAPNVESATAAFSGLAPDGTMVVLGVGPGAIQIDPIGLVMGRRRLLGSPAGSRQDLLETLNFAAEHGIRPRIKKYPLARAADAFDAVEHAQPSCRMVLVNEN